MNMKNKIREFFTLTRKGKGGFTLVELIVVIAILGILAGVAVPVYNGYIKKADKAADEQLLAAINKAFTSACLENAVDIYDTEAVNAQNAKLTIDGTTKALTYADDGLINEAVTADFAVFYGDNSSAKFKTYIRLVYDASTHSFKGVAGDGSGASAAYNQVLDSLLGEENADNLQKLVSSIWGEMGAGDLTGKVDWTADIATEMLALNPDGNFTKMITKCGDSMMSFMGITDPEEQMAKQQELMLAKMNQLIATDPQYAGMDAETAFNNLMNGEGSELEGKLAADAEMSISVNNAILTAAKTSDGAAENIRDILNSNNPKGELIASVNRGMNDEVNGTSGAMGEVALAYAMYMSYAERNNIEVKDATDVLNGLDDDGFKAYVNNTDGGENEFQTDMDGYLASMDMINNSVQGNEDAVTDVVLNGFGNSDLVSVLNQAMSSAKADD